MAAPVKKRLALDTNVVFDLADSMGVAHDFREICLERGYSLWLPPTAVEELVHFSESKDMARKWLAIKALKTLLSWKIRPYELSDDDRRLAKRFSRLLRDRGLLPDKEGNDGKILGEAAVEGIPILVTSDGHILDMDRKQLDIAFADSDLTTPVVPLPPRSILAAMRTRG